MHAVSSTHSRRPWANPFKAGDLAVIRLTEIAVALLFLTPYADVAQLVEHHLAKVRVAGSNPVVRSISGPAVLEPRSWSRASE